MATVTATVVPDQRIGIINVQWLALTTTNNVGSNIDLEDFQDRTVQVTGTFGAGGTVTIKGSNDGGNTWATLTDPLGNALTFTSAGMKQITELPGLIRPDAVAGDGTTSLNVYLHMRGRTQ